MFRDPPDGGERSPPQEAADRANHQPIGRERDQRMAVRTVHPRLGRELCHLSDLLGAKSENQLGGFWWIAGEKLGRAIDDEQPKIRAPELADETADHFPVSVSRQG